MATADAEACRVAAPSVRRRNHARAVGPIIENQYGVDRSIEGVRNHAATNRPQTARHL